MRLAVEELYANLLQFFIRALNWYQENTFKHILHSITRPVELRYRDLLERIEELSRKVDQLSASASRAEIRAIHIKISSVILKLDTYQNDSLNAILTKLNVHEESLLDIRSRIIGMEDFEEPTYVVMNVGRLTYYFSVTRDERKFCD